MPQLNSTTSMMPLSLPGFSNIHPFAPRAQVSGYSTIIKELSADLCRVTGFPAISLQPNSGAQGEYAGLSVIQAYHRSRGQGHRNICLIPNSAHGTNPASAIMAGMKVVAIKNKADGTLDIEDLREKAVKHKDNLGALMITYPSTYGVFEEGVSQNIRSDSGTASKRNFRNRSRKPVKLFMTMADKYISMVQTWCASLVYIML